jgi:MOSC domain-containing protein YiiM
MRSRAGKEARVAVDSSSVGDPGRFRALGELEHALRSLTAPRDAGRVALVVARVDGGRRETPARVRVGPDVGVPGDAWGRRSEPKPEGQIAVMQRDVAELIANGQPLTLFGDNLFLELDLSATNLPVGSRLRAGGATLEVTPKPHDGCRKFGARFGPDALRFVSKPELRHRNLRGIYLRVVEGGELGVGDPVEVLARGPAPAARG